jgi:adenylate cyclase
MPGTKPERGKTSNRRQSRLWRHTLVLAGVGLIFTVFFTFVQPFSFLQLWLSDQLFLAKSPSPNIVVVGIDDASLQTYGQWPWPRDLHAQAIDNLAAAGAQVIAFDVLFADSTPYDEELATAMANAGNVVVAMAGTQTPTNSGNGIVFDSFLVPTSPVLEEAASIGHANIIPDSDGKVRQLPLAIKDRDGDFFPSFSLAALYTMASMPLPDTYVRDRGNLHLLLRDVPVDSNDNLRINYAAPASSRPYLSYGDVVSGNFDPAVVKNKVVVIGMTATGELDTWEIPTSSAKVPGVFIQAAAMDTILRSQFLADTGTVANLLIMLLITAIVAAVLPRLRLKWGGLIVFVMFVAYIVISFILFDFPVFGTAHVLNLVYPPLLLALTFIASVVTMIFMEQADKRFVKDLFGRYVSPQVASQILNLADSGQLQLGGEQREATILFADIRGFTKLSETMSPKDIVNMLNAHLGVAIDRVLANGGMVNKFAGDNIMAVWNAPQPQAEHARLACKAACEIQHGLAELEEKDPSLPKAQFGIGINTGPVVAGNVGSSGRTEYTVIGDAVNLASRICSATPATEIWVGPETYHQTKEIAECITLELQTFKGKTEKVAVYRLLSCR